jgi:hypothetical protein
VSATSLATVSRCTGARHSITGAAYAARHLWRETRFCDNAEGREVLLHDTSLESYRESGFALEKNHSICIASASGDPVSLCREVKRCLRAYGRRFSRIWEEPSALGSTSGWCRGEASFLDALHLGHAALVYDYLDRTKFELLDFFPDDIKPVRVASRSPNRFI